MLNPSTSLRPLHREAGPQDRAAPSAADLLGVLRHQRGLILATVLACLLAALAYVATATRVYNATATLLLDVRQEDPAQKQRPSPDAQTEAAAIESQTQLLASDAIVGAVVRQLDLAHDPEFTEDGTPAPLRWVRAAAALFGSDDQPLTDQEVERTATERLVKAIAVSRVGRTYVVTVSALSRDPEKAARIANAVAEAYTEDQRTARLSAVDRSAEWLRTRAAELRQQSVEAERAVQQYSAQANRDRAEFRSLETTAQTYRTLFETFMQQYASTLQQQSFPIAYARVITPAKPPTRKSHPRTSLILLGSLVGGFGLGWLIGYARERLHPKLRTEREVERVTGLRSLGTLPDLGARRGILGRLRLLPANRAEPAGLAGPLLQHARLHPHSRFAHTIRHVRVALDLASQIRPMKVVGVLSAEPGDGKTVLATNLAQQLAATGARTLLIDLSLGAPAPGKEGQRAPAAPRPDAAAGDAPLDRVLVTDEETGLAVLTAGGRGSEANLAETLTSPAFGRLAAQMRERFDHVIVDLPCLEGFTEAHAVAGIVDGFVLVCSAERTHADRLTRAMDLWDTADLSPMIGFVLNRVRGPGRAAA